jgi:hypothetical protein
MVEEGNRLIAAVQKVEVAPDVQDFIQTECNKAFAKSDACLPGTDIVYLPDVSGSMVIGPVGVPLPWDQQLEFVRGINSQAIKYDKGGIDIWPIFTPTYLEKRINPEIERKLNVNDPNEAVKYVQGYRKDLRMTPTRNLYARLVGEVVKAAIADPVNTKRTLFLISTDGNPDKEGPTMHKTTNDAIIALHSEGLDPRRYIAVSYVILTQDFHTMSCYLKLEDCVNWSAGGKTKECDIANAMFPALINALGGFQNKTAVYIALGGAISSEIDTALENILEGPAKELMVLMKAYVVAGHAEDC